MAKQKLPPALNDYLSLMLCEVKDETDRAAALILTAWIDDALDEFLKARVVDNRKVIDDLFGSNRPLGTFSVRINIAYAFGHIGKNMYSDLHIVREIRNLFAHERGAVSFESQTIANRCACLTLVHAPDQKPTSSRDAFLITSLIYTAHLIDGATNESRPELAKLKELEDLLSGVRLIKGGLAGFMLPEDDGGRDELDTPLNAGSWLMESVNKPETLKFE